MVSFDPRQCLHGLDVLVERLPDDLRTAASACSPQGPQPDHRDGCEVVDLAQLAILFSRDRHQCSQSIKSQHRQSVSHADKDGRNLPTIRQPGAPEPSIINGKTIADFTCVVEQTSTFAREPLQSASGVAWTNMPL
jgi:hypothetical protein